MSLLLGIRHILRSLINRDTADDETREELAYHLARQTEKHIAAGVPADEARRLASIELGGETRWRGETSDARRGTLLLDAVSDAAHALRGLVARPMFAFSAFSTLAIGLGAATAIFAVADGALLRPLPFPGVDRVMSVSLRMPIRASARVIDMVWSYPKFALFRDRQDVFTAVALHSPETIVLTTADGAERIAGELASAPYFAILGVRPALGRTFTADEDRVGGPNSVVVLSDAFWRRQLTANVSAVGGSLTIGGTRYTIIGVMPPGFTGLSGDAELWIPVPAARNAAALQSAGAHNTEVVGRVRDGVAPAVAQAAVAALGREIDAVFPDDGGRWSAAAYPLSDVRANPAIRRTLDVLGAAVALLLIIVCINLGILLLTRGAARRQEMAVRLALGASQARLVRQLLTETLVLTALGALSGLVIATVATRMLASALPLAVPAAGSGTDLTHLAFSGITVGARGLAFLTVLGVAIGAGIGLVAALRVVGMGSVTALRQGASSSAQPSRGVIGRDGLIAAQVALAFVFLVGSGIALESLARTLRIPLGYNPQQLLTVRVTLDPVRVEHESPTALWDGVIRGIRALPGVRSVGIGSCSPIGMHCDGTDIAPSGRSGAAHVMFVTANPDYFASLETPLVRGRSFEPADTTVATRTMIVNRAAARAIWGADDPLAAPLMLDGQPTRVVGIVDDARYGNLEHAAEPAVFAPFRSTRGVLFIRTTGDASQLAPEIRRAIRRAGSGHAFGALQLMSDGVRDATIRTRLSAEVFTAFAASALLLASIGVYGALALRVSQRAREVAIRRALGASTRRVARLIASQAVTIAAVGGSLGLAAAVVMHRALAALLYDVQPLELATYVMSATLLIAALAVAAAVPTIRALRIDPRDAMRAE